MQQGKAPFLYSLAFGLKCQQIVDGGGFMIKSLITWNLDCICEVQEQKELVLSKSSSFPMGIIILLSHPR